MNAPDAFLAWYLNWWKNQPNQIAESNAQAAFFAGWDARGRSK
jgi:hypothetical protein